MMKHVLRSKMLALAAIVASCVAAIALATGGSPASAAVTWPVVQQGQTGANVQAVQLLLSARGYATTADGIFGAGTKASVVSFQRAKALSPDGIVGAATWPKLTSAIVRYGTTGSDVRAAQVLLNKYGYKLAVDGVFGDATWNAAVAFQRSHGLTQDGIVGPNTWLALASGATSGPPPPPTPTTTDCAKVTGPVPSSDTAVVTVAGYSFRVHKCLTASLQRLLTAANAQGHTLGVAASYRTYDQQVALRKQNCGTSYAEIYQIPASSCKKLILRHRQPFRALQCTSAGSPSISDRRAVS
jgi:peptidoglycan hydrolase-like protein with peptidoglycan-binding domain